MNCPPFSNHCLLSFCQVKALRTIVISGFVLFQDFNEFWLSYPKKTGKEAARKAWNKTRPNITIVLNALAWQKESKQWFEKGGQFIPNPATWINQHRWDDEMPLRVTF